MLKAQNSMVTMHVNDDNGNEQQKWLIKWWWLVLIH